MGEELLLEALEERVRLFEHREASYRGGGVLLALAHRRRSDREAEVERLLALESSTVRTVPPDAEYGEAVQPSCRRSSSR
ncbi:hypothetical protein [Streptomyces maremycinicus]|uniref:hypothetical protein n=1 Tax=Streptomyces maremycinicus TaxID=1679753 RepID=UPI000788A413|nr:hypothetical protein [Streptomyces sp. NBRC 110468]